MSRDEPTAPDRGLADPVVRPFGYVEDHPVIRRLGERDLYIGNARAADADRTGCSFDYVLSTTSDRRPLTTHHHPLVDGDEAEWRAFEAAADAARRLVRRDGSLLVHCKAGVSRSSALLATALAAEERVPLRDSLATVQRYRPVAMPHPSLHELAVIYLAART